MGEDLETTIKLVRWLISYSLLLQPAAPTKSSNARFPFWRAHLLNIDLYKQLKLCLHRHPGCPQPAVWPTPPTGASNTAEVMDGPRTFQTFTLKVYTPWFVVYTLLQMIWATTALLLVWEIQGYKCNPRIISRNLPRVSRNRTQHSQCHYECVKWFHKCYWF